LNQTINQYNPKLEPWIKNLRFFIFFFENNVFDHFICYF